jgi:hypothetical protein
MERRPKLTDAQYAALIERNRERYGTSGGEGKIGKGVAEDDGGIGKPDLL